VSELRLREEIGQIDRSILLLVDARDRAVAQLVAGRADRTGLPEGSERDEVALARGWAAETGISERVASRVARWLHQEGARARHEPGLASESPTAIYVVARPPVPIVGPERVHHSGVRAQPVR